MWKPELLVSACLAGIPCRMDGQSRPVQAIVELVASGSAIPVCPEMLGGLPVPRPPAELRDGRVVTQDGTDVTVEFVRGAERALEICQHLGCRAAVLKSRSPSCGLGSVHNGLFDGGMVPGNGIFAEVLLANSIELNTEESWQPQEANVS